MEIVQKNCYGVCKSEGIEKTPVVSIDGDIITTAKTQVVCEEVLRRAGKIEK